MENQLMLGKKIWLSFVIALTVLTQPLSVYAYEMYTGYSRGQEFYDHNPWSVMGYYGYTYDNSLYKILTLGKLDRWPEEIGAAEIMYTLDSANGFANFFSPYVSVTQLALNTAVRTGKNQDTIYEVNPYVAFRWTDMPWDDYLTTSFAFGIGVSYDSGYASVEKNEEDDTKRLLAFLMLESAFSMPSYPNWQLVLRIHHRSGAFGLFRAGNTGTNNVGLGIRYLF